jgi:hypothetical protein
MKAKLA